MSVRVGKAHGFRRHAGNIADHLPKLVRLVHAEGAEVDIHQDGPGVAVLDDHRRRPELHVDALGTVVHAGTPIGVRDADGRRYVGAADADTKLGHGSGLLDCSGSARGDCLDLH